MGNGDFRGADGRLAVSLTQADDGGVLLVLAGELDLSGVDLLATCVAKICTIAAPVRLDLASLGFVDVAGARVLVATCQFLRRRDQPVQVRNIRAKVQRVLDLLDLTVTDGTEPASPRPPSIAGSVPAGD